jgi:hypothetical protein
MKDINSYKNRFYSLLESELGDVKPIISEAGPYDPNADKLDSQPTSSKQPTQQPAAGQQMGPQNSAFERGDQFLERLKSQSTTAATPTQSTTAATPTQSTTAATQSNQTKTPYTKTEVIKMQDALKALKLSDINPGTSDGRIGPNTLGAVSKLIEKYNELKKSAQPPAQPQPAAK